MDARKNVKNKPNDLFDHATQVDQITLHMANNCEEERLLYQMVVKYYIILLLLKRETISIPPLSADSMTREGHDKSKVNSVAHTMDNFVRRDSNALLITDDDKMKDMIDALMNTVGQSEKTQKLNVAKHIVSRLIEDLKVTLPYLHIVSKDYPTGTIQTPFVYGCEGVDPDGNYII